MTIPFISINVAIIFDFWKQTDRLNPVPHWQTWGYFSTSSGNWQKISPWLTRITGQQKKDWDFSLSHIGQARGVISPVVGLLYQEKIFYSLKRPERKYWYMSTKRNKHRPTVTAKINILYNLEMFCVSGMGTMGDWGQLQTKSVMWKTPLKWDGGFRPPPGQHPNRERKWECVYVSVVMMAAGGLRGRYADRFIEEAASCWCLDRGRRSRRREATAESWWDYIINQRRGVRTEFTFPGSDP